ncbi:MAG: small multi-drug export protein [Oscillospiraceae bacterium]|nr:small multi-drug export protein [Oscillospiraceae bacterium]
MLPVGELRVGLPYGIALGLEYPLALMAALLGNMVPVPFIIVYIKRIFAWLRRHMPRMNALITKLEDRANLKGETVQKYGHWGLLLFVAIPLPGTGAWTGSLIAALLNIRTAKAVPVILIGVCIAAAIMTLITYGVIHVL